MPHRLDKEKNFCYNNNKKRYMEAIILVTIILGCLLAVAMLFIFCILKVLKNTFLITDYKVKKISKNLAYDGKYFPATLILQAKFNCNEEYLITDFSLYNTHKIVGFIVNTKKSMNEYFNISDEDSDGISEEDSIQTIVKNVIVYAPMEGIWTWKSVD